MQEPDPPSLPFFPGILHPLPLLVCFQHHGTHIKNGRTEQERTRQAGETWQRACLLPPCIFWQQAGCSVLHTGWRGWVCPAHLFLPALSLSLYSLVCSLSSQVGLSMMEQTGMGLLFVPLHIAYIAIACALR